MYVSIGLKPKASAVELPLAPRLFLAYATMLRLQFCPVPARLVAFDMTAGLLGLAHRGLPQKGWGCSKGRELRGIVREFPCPSGRNPDFGVLEIRLASRAPIYAPQAKIASRRESHCPPKIARRGR